MASEHLEKVQIVQEGDFESRRRVVEHRPSGRNVFIARLNQVIWIVSSVVQVFLGFRFLFMMAAANPSNGFANFVYNLTSWLVYPFQTLLANPVGDNGTVIEITTIIAMIAYLLATVLLTTLIRTLFVDKSGVRKVTSVERS